MWKIIRSDIITNEDTMLADVSVMTWAEVKVVIDALKGATGKVCPHYYWVSDENGEKA